MIDGKQIILAGTEYTLPALPFGKLTLLSKLTQNPLENEESASAMIDAIFYSLRRNYPNLTRETVENGIDLLNCGQVFAAFSEANQMEPSKPGEAQAAAST